MSSFRIRPHFQQTVDLDRDTAQEQIVNRLREAKCGCEVKNFPGYLTLRIPEKDQHFWSPQLNLSLDSDETGKTVIQGIYGPNTNVWAMFLYSYLIVGFLAIGAAVVGLSQWMIGATPWGLWGLAAALIVGFGLYVFAQTGQKLGVWQMFKLHQAYEAAVGEEAEIR